LTFSNNIATGTNDFTIEWWEYPTVTANNKGVYHSAYSTSSVYGLLVGYQYNGKVQTYASANGSSWDVLNGIDMGTLRVNEWTHRALVRKGSTFYMFENGKLYNTATSSGSISAL
jgi:hypothetical protein